MIASLQADTIDYKKVVIKGNESKAVAVLAFQKAILLTILM
jgi:hypothetical protein